MEPRLRSRTATLAIDLGGLVLIGVALVAVHSLVPPSIQEEFVFYHTLSEPLSLLTAAYLHVDAAHLWSNLFGFGLAGAGTYALCRATGQRRWFWLTTVVFLTVFPVLVNFSAMVVWNVLAPAVSVSPTRGFSGITAGYSGFLAIALLVALRRQFSRRTTAISGLLVLVVLNLVLLVLHSPSLPTAGLVIGIVGLGLGVVELLRQGTTAGRRYDRGRWLEYLGTFSVVALVVLVLAILVALLFPTRLVANGTVIDVMAHTLGLLYGAVISVWGYRYWRTR